MMVAPGRCEAIGERPGGALIDIYAATVADAATILTLQRLAFAREAERYNTTALPPLRQTLAELEAEFATHSILKAVIAGTIVGSVRGVLLGDECSIGRLMVHPDWQRRGIGSALMAQIEAQFPTARRFQLFTGARSTDNIQFYRRLGYTIASTERRADHIDLVVMTKPA